MAVNLRNFNKPKHATNMMNSQSFQAKNNIVVNNPVQTHFTIEGVQQYTADELKALKIKQDRLMENKDGQYIQLKVVLLSDQVIENENKVQVKPKQKQKDKQKEKTKNRPKSRINPRNAVSSNNQALVKIQKQKQVKDHLQKRLSKLQQKYKEHFKEVDLKEGLKPKEEHQEEEEEDKQESQYRQEEEEEEEEKTKQEITTTYHSFGRVKPSAKMNDSQSQISEFEESQGGSVKNNSLGIGLNFLTQCSSYSERLGTAVHKLFE